VIMGFPPHWFWVYDGSACESAQRRICSRRYRQRGAGLHPGFLRMVQNMKNIGASAPRRLIGFLIGTRCEGYSRARAATAISASASTVDRALRVLLRCGAITRHHGGRSTPSKIRVIISITEFLTRYKELTRYVGKSDALRLESDALSGAYNLKVEDKERQPPQMEQVGNHREHGQSSMGSVWTAQERALYARFQREYPFASPSQFAAYRRDCEAAA